MSVYYVRTDGNDLNPGSGYTTTLAYKTLAKAISVVAAGDTVRIAPQTFYETMTLATGGGSTTIISWVGDKEAQYFLDLKPGPVRITGCNSGTGIGAANPVIHLNSKAYQNFYNLVIDGGAAGASFTIRYAAAVTNFYDCIISGSYVAVYGGEPPTAPPINCYRCILISSSYSAYSVNTYNCILYSAVMGQSYGTSYNTISISDGAGFDGTASPVIVINCVAIGSLYGYKNANTTNCVAFCCQYGFWGLGSSLIIKKGKAINCATAAYGSSAASKITVSDFKYTHCYNIPATNIIGTATEAKLETYTDISKLLKIATALKFDIFEEAWSSDLHSLTVAGTTTPAAANNDYVNVGTYNSQILYQSIFKDHLIFYSTALSNWVIEANATTTPTEPSIGFPNYAYYAGLTPVGTYSNAGTWAGTTVVSTFAPIAFSESYDVLRQPRRMGSGSTLDCGAFEYSNTALEWTTYKTFAPSIKISQAGYKTLTIPVKMNISKTISCWTQFNLDDGGGTANKPQMIISASGISENILSTTDIVVTATGDGTVWEKLTSTFTPIASGFLTVNFYNRYQGDSNNSVAYFSDISFQ